MVLRRPLAGNHMSRLHIHSERHAVSRIGWLRAAVLGANDGIVSTGSLIVGVAPSRTDQTGILVACTATIVTIATSIAAGEHLRVHSHAHPKTTERTSRREQELSSL